MRTLAQAHPDPTKELVAEALIKVGPRHREVLLLAYWEQQGMAGPLARNSLIRRA